MRGEALFRHGLLWRIVRSQDSTGKPSPIIRLMGAKGLAGTLPCWASEWQVEGKQVGKIQRNQLVAAIGGRGHALQLPGPFSLQIEAIGGDVKR